MLIKDASLCILGKQDIPAKLCQGGPRSWGAWREGWDYTEKMGQAGCRYAGCLDTLKKECDFIESRVVVVL